MRIYLDNCCYNRPYDDQSHPRVLKEAQAVLRIEQLIKEGKIELVTSFVLVYENNKKTYIVQKAEISDFMKKNAFMHIKQTNQVMSLSRSIMKYGLHTADAMHTAAAVFAHCDYFITTDDKITRKKFKLINAINPCKFIKIWEDLNNERGS